MMVVLVTSTRQIVTEFITSGIYIGSNFLWFLQSTSVTVINLLMYTSLLLFTLLLLLTSYSLFLDIISGTGQTEVPSSSVSCSKEVILNKNNSSYEEITSTVPNVSFEMIWDLYSTVPIILGIAMFPFLNFKSPTFFTKFSSFGKLLY